jgi:hypothetical protein
MWWGENILKKNIYWRDIYNISLWPLSFSIGSLGTLDSYFPFFSSNLLFKIAKRLFKGHKKICPHGPRLRVLLGHRNLLDYDWDHFKILLESVICDFMESPKNIISPPCFQLNHMENGNKDTSPELILKVQKLVRGSYSIQTKKYPFCQNI